MPLVRHTTEEQAFYYTPSGCKVFVKSLLKSVVLELMHMYITGGLYSPFPTIYCYKTVGY